VMAFLNRRFGYLRICEAARWWIGYTLMSGLTNSVVNPLSRTHNMFLETHCVRHIADYCVMESRRRTKETHYVHIVSSTKSRLQ
jgi:hypothetical protein